MDATTVDLLDADFGLDLLTVLSVLTEGYYGVAVLAEEAGLSVSRTCRCCEALVAYGQAKHRTLEGYALRK